MWEQGIVEMFGAQICTEASFFPAIPEVWASIDRLVIVSSILQFSLYMTFCMLKLQDWKPSGQRAFEVSIHVQVYVKHMDELGELTCQVLSQGTIL